MLLHIIYIFTLAVATPTSIAHIVSCAVITIIARSSSGFCWVGTHPSVNIALSNCVALIGSSARDPQTQIYLFVFVFVLVFFSFPLLVLDLAFIYLEQRKAQNHCTHRKIRSLNHHCM